MARKPMRGLDGGSMGVMSSRIASNSDWMWVSWLATLRSNSANLAARSLFVASIARNRTNALTTWTLISTARGLFSTIAAMMAPCSVKAHGR